MESHLRMIEKKLFGFLTFQCVLLCAHLCVSGSVQNNMGVRAKHLEAKQQENSLQIKSYIKKPKY